MDEIQNKNLTEGEKIALKALSRVESGERHILASEKKRDIILVLALFLIIFMVGFFVWYATSAEDRLKSTIKDFTVANRTFKNNDLDWKGQKDEFRQLMMRVFRVYGKAYNSVDVRALSRKERPLYIDLCFDLAKGLGHPLTQWHGPIFGIMESALNPFARGDYKIITIMVKNKKGKMVEEEVKIPTSFGLYQMKQSCGIYYKYYYDIQPDWFKKKYPIRYATEEDALNWRTATILLYCGMWGAYNKTYKGVHRFAISSHRFGPVLQWYFNDGNGALPASFTYIVNGDKVTYPVSDYWTDFLGMKECFEAGEIELGKPFKLHWDGVKKSIRREEEEFSRNYNTFKHYKKQIDQLKTDKNDRDKRILNLEKDIDATYKKFVKAYGEIHEGNYKSVSYVFTKTIKGPIKEWMKKYHSKKKREKVYIWITFIIGILAIITLFIIMIILSVKYILQYIKARRIRAQ